MSTERPNILCIVSEDCPPRLGAYGDTIARSPNLDRLASEGVVYDNAAATSPVCAPSRFSILTGRHPENVPPAQHMTAWGHMPRSIITYPEMMRAAGYYCTNNSKTHYNVDLDPNEIWDETSGKAHWFNRPAGKPFLAVFNTMLTHESCVFQEHPGAVGPEDVIVPAYLPDTDGTRISLARYYNQIEAMDAWMGDRLEELAAAGLEEDTIVFYYSDHASPMPRSKRFCYDDGVRVPLIVKVPEKWRHLLPEAPGSHITAPVSLVDLLPTFAEIIGVAPPEDLPGQAFMGAKRKARRYTFSGRDRMDEHYDLTRTVRSERYRYIRNYAPHRIYGQHYAFAWNGLGYQDFEAEHLANRLTDPQESFWRGKPAEELYDMDKDPDAVVNLAGDPDYAATLDEMSKALDAHMLATHDCGFIPEGSDAEAVGMRDDPLVYPVAEVIELAARAIRRDPGEASHFVAALGHNSSSVMRYWGAQGLLMLAVAGHPLPPETKTLLDEERDPHVRIPLAEALGHAGDAEPYVRLITKMVEQETKPVLRLQAICALTDLPKFPDVSLDTMTKAAEDGDEYVRGGAGYLKLKIDGTYTPTSQVFRFDMFTGQSGHAGIGPQEFPSLEDIRSKREESGQPADGR